MATGFIFQLPKIRPVGSYGTTLPNSYINFFYTATTSFAPIYANSSLTAPLVNPIVADGTGQFPTIYLDPAITYRIQFYDQYHNLQYDIDPGAYDISIDTEAPLYAIKNFSTVVVNSSTLVQDGELIIPNVPIGTYEFDSVLMFYQTATNTAGHKFQFNYTGNQGALQTIEGLGYVGSAAYSTPGAFNGFNGPIFNQTNSDVTGVIDFIRYKGIVNLSSSGNMFLSWAQSIPNTNGSYLYLGSYIKLTPT